MESLHTTNSAGEDQESFVEILKIVSDESQKTELNFNGVIIFYYGKNRKV